MRVNELMIGDWCLLNKRLEKVSVLTIFGEDVGISDHWYPLKCIEPIPLTPELLEKNGFSDRGKAGWQNPDYDATYYLDKYTFAKNVYKCTIDDSVDVDLIHNIKYVHELQHALRLCGLNELADNFKV